MEAKTASRAALREQVEHPIIDSDGHTVEFMPLFYDYLREVGGPKLVERHQKGGAFSFGSRLQRWYELSPDGRRQHRITRPAWWVPTARTLDRATVAFPKLLYERLDEIGLDYTVLYPTVGRSPTYFIEDDELRRAACRAYNKMYAEECSEYKDRIEPAATIPMHTPAEAVEELEYAVKTLGMKVVVMSSHIKRPVPKTAEQGQADEYWFDNFGIDSEYDYDSVWAKCVELGVAPTFHVGCQGIGFRTSISNYMYNHIGHFAASGEAICKALFFGGVTHRFPTLKFAFLEGGVAWACSLLCDLVGHWEKRNGKAVQNYNPAQLNRDDFVELCRRYGGKRVEGRLEALMEGRSFFGMFESNQEDPAMLDEFAACGIQKKEDIRQLFVPNFYFGCEADDPTKGLR
jgi:predicted TIM-barrel fold metal-dependent hydrolase